MRYPSQMWGDPPSQMREGTPPISGRQRESEKRVSEESHTHKQDFCSPSLNAKTRQAPGLGVRTPTATEYERLKTIIEQYMEAELPADSTIVEEILRVATASEAIEILASRYQAQAVPARRPARAAEVGLVSKSGIDRHG